MKRADCKTMDDVKRFNQEVGNYWFTPETMKFFDSCIESELYRTSLGYFFITSEQAFESHSRFFTVRQVQESGSIKTVGSFQQFKIFEEAEEFLHERLV